MTKRPDIPCLTCGTMIVQPLRGRTARYCVECRKARHAIQMSERKAEIRADQNLLREIAESMRDYLEPSMYATVVEYIEALGIRPHDVVPLSHDRMPEGSASNAGSDDGMSTTYPDLQAELDAKRMTVIMHDWFADNPHWQVGL